MQNSCGLLLLFLREQGGLLDHSGLLDHAGLLGSVVVVVLVRLLCLLGQNLFWPFLLGPFPRLDSVLGPSFISGCWCPPPSWSRPPQAPNSCPSSSPPSPLSLSSFPRCAEEAGAILILDLISISEWHIILLTVNKPHAQALIKKAQLEQLLPLWRLMWDWQAEH